MPLILGTNSIKDTGYDVANSLRFNDPSNETLTRTFTAGNQKTWSFSTWIKKGILGVNNAKIIGTDYIGLGEAYLLFKSSNILEYGQYTGGGASGNYRITTNQVFRDTTAWMNILLVWNTTESTSSDRIKLYINGTQVTSLSIATYPTLNYDGVWNRSGVHYIGGGLYGDKYDGYLCETVFVDGTALSPTDVGEFDSDSPTIWKPKDVSGLTFGTNGFYQEYKQSGTSANSSGLGADTSGNDHHFTVNNFTAIDQSTDTCTNNFATYNNLLPVTVTFSDGNLTGVTSSNFEAFASTISVTKGKWYCEIYPSSLPTDNSLIGVEDVDLINVWQNSYPGHSANGYGYWSYLGQKYNNNSASSYGSDYAGGDIICIALDMDNKKLYFRRDNNAWENSGNPESGATGTGALSLSGTEYVFVASCYTGTISANFGSPPYAISSGNSDGNGYGNFEYAVPSGYYSLNTKNLAEFG